MSSSSYAMLQAVVHTTYLHESDPLAHIAESIKLSILEDTMILKQWPLLKKSHNHLEHILSNIVFTVEQFQYRTLSQSIITKFIPFDEKKKAQLLQIPWVCTHCGAVSHGVISKYKLRVMWNEVQGFSRLSHLFLLCNYVYVPMY